MEPNSAEMRARQKRAEHVRLAAHCRSELEKHLAIIAAIDEVFPPELSDEQVRELERQAETHGQLTRLVEQIILSKEGGRVRRLDVQKELIAAHGYVYSDAFKVTLFKTLQRLLSKGRIAGEKEDGTWFFWSKAK